MIVRTYRSCRGFRLALFRCAVLKGFVQVTNPFARLLAAEQRERIDTDCAERRTQRGQQIAVIGAIGKQAQMGEEVDNLDPLPPVLAPIRNSVEAKPQQLLAVGRHRRATLHQNDDLTLARLAALDQSFDAASNESRLSTVACELIAFPSNRIGEQQLNVRRISLQFIVAAASDRGPLDTAGNVNL